MTAFADLANLDEDERIDIIGRTVMEDKPSSAIPPMVAGVVVEDDVKADRYIKKLLDKFPGIRVISRGPGPIKESVLIRIAGPLR